jgi:hypothetical protein
MRLRFSTIFILLCFLTFGQRHQWESLPFEGELPVISPVYEKLDVIDTNALILVLSNWRYRSLVEYKEYIVFHLDGSIEIRTLYETRGASNKNDIKVYKVKEGQGVALWAFLDSCLRENLFVLDQEKLDLQSGPKQRRPYKTKKITVADGVNFSFGLLCGRKYLNYHTYAPDAYIKAGFPGAADRVQFMLIYSAFQKIKSDLLRKPLHFFDEPVDSIFIQSHKKLEGHADQKFATKGRADYLKIEWSDFHKRYFVTSYYRDKYVSTRKPDTLKNSRKNLLKEPYEIDIEALKGLLTAFNSNKSTQDLLMNLDTTELQNLLSDWRLIKTSHNFQTFYYLSMKHLGKSEGIPTLQDYHSSDSILSYLKERFDTNGYYTVVSGYKADINLHICTKSETWHLQGKYPNPLNQPWYNLTDSISEDILFSILNFQINEYLLALLPEDFLFRNRLTLKALANDYISWYLKKQGMGF